MSCRKSFFLRSVSGARSCVQTVPAFPPQHWGNVKPYQDLFNKSVLINSLSALCHSSSLKGRQRIRREKKRMEVRIREKVLTWETLNHLFFHHRLLSPLAISLFPFLSALSISRSCRRAVIIAGVNVGADALLARRWAGRGEDRICHAPGHGGGKLTASRSARRHGFIRTLL